MTRMLVAGLIATLITIGFGSLFINWLKRNEFGQPIREEGPSSHKVKEGIPTMGGLLILIATSIPFWLVGTHTAAGLLIWLTFVITSMIGFWDDWMKISNRRSLGLSGKVKMLLLTIVAVIFAFATSTLLDLGTAISIPLLGTSIDLGGWYYLLAVVMMAGASNAVNLTDGIDGLAATTVVISLVAFTGINFITWERDLSGIGQRGSIDVAIFTTALGGACIGFLWHNAHPARVFMGDTGSMGLGGALAGLALITKSELLLIVIGGIFVVEAMSVILQVASFKRFGKRIFLMTPIHHHFEMKNWSETQIMVRFAIISGLLSATGFTMWFHSV